MKKGSTNGGADSSGSGRGGSKVIMRSDGSFYFEVDSTPGETTVVSWKKLLRDHAAEIAAGASSASRPIATPNPCPDARIAPVLGPDGGNAGSSSRLNSVIEKIERLYVKASSDEEDCKDLMPDDDEYDTDDSFIDDSDLNEYFRVDKSATKYDGYFVHKGKLEEVEPSMSPNEQSKKRRGNDLAEDSDGRDNDPNPSKHAKPGKKARVNNTPGLSAVIALPIQPNSSPSKTDSKTREQVSEAGGVATISNADPEKITIPEAQPVDQQQKLVMEPRDRRIILRIPCNPMRARLENAIEDLEKLVAEFGQASSSSQAIRRRLPQEIKDKLAKVVGYALRSDRKILKELVDRLMTIVGHLVGRKTLKRNLKKMVDAELSAGQEIDSIEVSP